MTTFGAVIVSRNDNYGGFLYNRALYCLMSMSKFLDEIIYVDWNSPKESRTLIEDLKQDLPKLNNIKWIKVSPEQAKELCPDSEAQLCVEVLGRNIGLRRLNTDFLISTNIDVICPKREYIEKITDQSIFYTTAKRSVALETLFNYGLYLDIDNYIEKLEAVKDQVPQERKIQLCDGDIYSLVSGCGDFQIAHKDIWYGIRGFEERLYKRQYADTNIQRKAVLFGYGLDVDWSMPVYHIAHGGGMGGQGGINDMNLSVFMNETTNLETWGFSNLDFEVHSL